MKEFYEDRAIQTKDEDLYGRNRLVENIAKIIEGKTKKEHGSFTIGVSVRHDGGVATSSSEEKTCHSVLKCIIALYRNNADDHVVNLQWCRERPSLSIKVWLILLIRYIKRLIKTA